MSRPKVTLAEILARQRARPMTPELELAIVDFLDLSDAEQKIVIFRGLVELSANVDWLLARLR